MTTSAAGKTVTTLSGRTGTTANITPGRCRSCRGLTRRSALRDVFYRLQEHRKTQLVTVTTLTGRYLVMVGSEVIDIQPSRAEANEMAGMLPNAWVRPETTTNRTVKGLCHV